MPTDISTPRVSNILIVYSIAMTAAIFILMTTSRYSPSVEKTKRMEQINRTGPEDSVAAAEYFSLYAKKKFHPLIARLEATSAMKARELQEILIEREVRLATSGRRSDDTRSSIASAQAKIQKEVQARITDELGPDIFKETERYLNTLPLRAFIGVLNQELAYSGEALDSSKIEQLIVVLEKNTQESGAHFASAHEIDGRIAARLQAQGQILNQATLFLSPKQIAALQREFDLEIAFLRRHRERVVPSPAGRQL